MLLRLSWRSSIKTNAHFWNTNMQSDSYPNAKSCCSHSCRDERSHQKSRFSRTRMIERGHWQYKLVRIFWFWFSESPGWRTRMIQRGHWQYKLVCGLKWQPFCSANYS
jgi:hypothetical protein